MAGHKNSPETRLKLKKVDHWWSRGANNYGWRGGIIKHPLYKTWNNMYSRCYNKNESSYKYYGRRGITLSKDWLDSKNFIDDMFPSWKKGLTLERIDVNG